ncbi:kinetochore-associated Ndc80 complex subunit ndc80 [Cadophora gregata]|uniref:kinetochore-associated Ndc80 complex subunit ndc80 n=1 Tax=Cadophora gregata TaxID=51156 RepID=UPI0026DD2BD3|nr:kinetochore-associated Ndc80 complex subunit ndc80 [Cadophora gregata]KAK0117746.1 kinetochore-associated Ndc80 complex subunit ndc80 [Cadophora gregata]KAK0122795.1 kinetochore-associated Ndc80 complex subunit ndc80 [Cadophora gregata f. sp. sojae]
MSQDTGLFSVRRPRETLGGINHNSSIPQPASAMKRSNSMSGPNMNAPFTISHVRSISGSRASLAPPRPSQPQFQRSSSGTNLAEMGTSSVKRTSFQNTSGRKSFAPGTTGRSSAESVERRSSSYHRSRSSTNGAMGHQSFFQQAPQPAGVPKDPRPLRDRTYQAKIGQELLDYMAANNFEMEMKHPLTQNIIKSPTQKDFNFMFQWLYHRIDPSYRFQKAMDQEVLPILIQLRYPYHKTITKSSLTACGSANSWHIFLGLLHWMMQLSQMLDGYAANQYDDACAEMGVDVSGDRIIFGFLSGAYRAWLSMDEEAGDEDQDKVLAPHIEAMAQEFDRSNSKYLDELQILEGEHVRLQKEIELLERSGSDVAILDRNFKIMEEDKVKFEEFDSRMNQKSEKYESRIEFLQGELDKVLAELKEADEERANLQKAVDDQGISMADIDRMTAERERLQKGIESTSQRLEDAKKKVSEKEGEASRKLEDLERMVDKYNSLGYQIGLIPATAANAKGKNYELQVTANEGPNFSSSQMAASGSGNADSDRLLADPVTGYQPAHILNLDLRGQVRASFLSLRKEISERRTVAMDEMMKHHDLLDGIKEAIEDKRGEVEALEHRVRAAEEEYEKTKEVTTTQKIASDTQIEKMEKELAKMRAGLTESVQLMEQREMNTNIEYEQLTLKANALREELHTEIEKMLNDIIKFKVHIQKNLEDYEGFVVDEVEHELGGDDEGREDTQDVEMS